MRDPTRIRIKEVNGEFPLDLCPHFHKAPNSCSILFTKSFITLIRAYHL